MGLKYCIPLEAGLASEGPAVGRRIARLLKALGDEVQSLIVSGQVIEDVWRFRTDLITKLREDGWRIKVLESGRLSVLVPKGYLDGAYGRNGGKS